jgi:hypothetical protein
VLLNQLPLPDLPETLITSLVFLHRVHPITLKLPIAIHAFVDARRLRRIVGMPCTRGGEGVGVVKSVPPP